MRNEIRWLACPMCKEMVLKLDEHRCHPNIVEKLEYYLDYAVSQELEWFDEELETFWNSDDVKFFEFLLKKEENDENTSE